LPGGNEENHEHLRWMVNGYLHIMVIFLHPEKMTRLLNNAVLPFLWEGCTKPRKPVSILAEI
jgi:hypothetical protein